MAEPKDSRVALGVTRENLRQHNLGVVLSVLHAEGAVPRSRLTTVSGLNRSTISDLVGELAGPLQGCVLSPKNSWTAPSDVHRTWLSHRGDVVASRGQHRHRCHDSGRCDIGRASCADCAPIHAPTE